MWDFFSVYVWLIPLICSWQKQICNVYLFLFSCVMLWLPWPLSAHDYHFHQGPNPNDFFQVKFCYELNIKKSILTETKKKAGSHSKCWLHSILDPQCEIKFIQQISFPVNKWYFFCNHLCKILTHIFWLSFHQHNLVVCVHIPIWVWCHFHLAKYLLSKFAQKKFSDDFFKKGTPLVNTSSGFFSERNYYYFPTDNYFVRFNFLTVRRVIS
jgi:hypothetical protein